MKLFSKTRNNDLNHVILKKITLWYAVNIVIAERSYFDRKNKKIYYKIINFN